MKMIAIGTVQGRKTIRAKDPKNPSDAGEYEDKVIPPDGEFDTEELGIDEDEVKRLVALGAAKRKTREVDDDSAGKDAPGKPQAKPAGAAKPGLA